MYKNLITIVLIIFSYSGVDALQSQPFRIGIILGSTRDGRSSEKIGREVQRTITTHFKDVRADVLDLRTFNLPFLIDSVSPAMREKITDPVVQKWSDTVKSYNAFIIVVPEYNGSFPGVLKNALDSLFSEWDKKAVGFVAYSGSANGGINALNQLRAVTLVLNMVPVKPEITIGSSWKAFDQRGKLVGDDIEGKIITMVRELQKATKN